MRLYKADVLYGKCAQEAVIVESVQFSKVVVTKNDALVKEVAELYKAATLHELIRKCHLASRHLQEMGLMESASAWIDYIPGSSHSYIVNFDVREVKPFQVGVRAGMTTHGDADVSVNATRQNALGRGEDCNAVYSHTIKGDQAFSVTARKPFLGWQRYANVSISIHRVLSALPWCHSDSTENGVSLLYTGEYWTRRVRHALRFTSCWREFVPRKEAAFAIREHAGHTMKCAIENTLAYDTRDRRQLASSGMLLQAVQEYAGLVGDAAFFRHQFDVQIAARLGLGTILSAGLRSSLIQSLGGRTLHSLDRTFLGGPLDVRGFVQNCIGPRVDDSCLGGGSSLAAAVHLYRPLFPPRMLFAHAFLVSGAVASVRSRSHPIPLSFSSCRHPLRDMLEAPRVATGIGVVFVYEDLLRMELNYVLPIRNVIGDRLAPGIQFGVGINFL